MENISSSKLFTTRQGTVLLGVIAAVIAAIALLVYLNHYRDSVNASNAGIRVLVASQLIQKGTPGSVVARTPSLYQVATIPKKQVESGAIVDPATLEGKFALTDINPNQQLTAADFGPGTGLTTNLGPNERAVVVSLGSPEQVGGQITAGSHVDVWVSGTSQSSTNGANKQSVFELFQNMYVMGVSGGNTTMRATPTQAGQLIWSAQNAHIWLVLRPTVGTVTKPPVISNVGH